MTYRQERSLARSRCSANALGEMRLDLASLGAPRLRPSPVPFSRQPVGRLQERAARPPASPAAPPTWEPVTPHHDDISETHLETGFLSSHPSSPGAATSSLTKPRLESPSCRLLPIDSSGCGRCSWRPSFLPSPEPERQAPPGTGHVSSARQPRAPPRRYPCCPISQMRKLVQRR